MEMRESHESGNYIHATPIENVQWDNDKIISDLTAALNEARLLHRQLCEDIMRCLPADWKPYYARDYGAHLGNILAEYVGDVVAERDQLAAKLQEAERALAQARTDLWNYAYEEERGSPADKEAAANRAVAYIDAALASLCEGREEGGGEKGEGDGTGGV